ncbi:N-acetylmuramoyl-L-alanine amidase [Microcoleus sp. FACHB-1515]|nr:N-acetylmuramoyl-L-alanine amidase [Microcoleus sp. FACHB-1515]
MRSRWWSFTKLNSGIGRMVILSVAALAIVFFANKTGASQLYSGLARSVPDQQSWPTHIPVLSQPKQTTPPAAAQSPLPAPRQERALVDPSNYGPRFATDINGNPVNNALIVVMHETVGSAQSAINTFQTPHPNDADQVSYHSLIRRDGTIVYLVPPEMRAFGAGNSVFVGANGAETVRLLAGFPPSVNNFAYHTSLETPPDGRGNQRSHSGYTDAQYRSLAWLIAQTRVPNDRITTHQAVDRSGTRLDPRSFDRSRLMQLLQTYPRS